MQWLQQSHPELVPEYERLYGRKAYLPQDYRSALRSRVAPLLARYGLTGRGPAAPVSAVSEVAAPAQPTLF
jgi:hypothetical protein